MTTETNHLSAYTHYREQAESYLDAACSVGNIDAGRECLATAQVYATLALAAASANNAPRCPVHCSAMGC